MVGLKSGVCIVTAITSLGAICAITIQDTQRRQSSALASPSIVAGSASQDTEVSLKSAKAGKKININGIPISCRLSLINTLTASKPPDFYSDWAYTESQELLKAYLQNGFYDEAWKVTRNPVQKYEVLHQLAADGQLAKSKQYLQQIPTNPYQDNGKVLIELYAISGQPEIAYRMFKEMDPPSNLSDADLVAKSFSSSGVLSTISARFFKQQKSEQGEQIYQDILSHYPLDPIDSSNQRAFGSGLLVMTRNYVEAGELEQALKVAEMIAVFPRDDDQRGFALLAVAEAYISRHQIDQAVAVLKQVEEISLRFQALERESGYPIPRPNRPSYAPGLIGEYIIAYAKAGEYDHALNLVNQHERLIGQQIMSVNVAQEAINNGDQATAKRIISGLEQASDLGAEMELKLSHSFHDINLTKVYRAIGQAKKSESVLKKSFDQLKQPTTGELPITTQREIYGFLEYYLSIGEYEKAEQVIGRASLLKDVLACAQSEKVK
jgi:tetratricopeptide (TPR) repeat protein